MMGLGGMLGTTAAVAEMTSKVHGSAANVVEHRVGLVLAVRTVDCWCIHKRGSAR